MKKTFILAVLFLFAGSAAFLNSADRNTNLRLPDDDLTTEIPYCINITGACQ